MSNSHRTELRIWCVIVHPTKVTLERPYAPWPYDFLPAVPEFAVASRDIHDGETLSDLHVADGGNLSPHLDWTGFPRETKSFAVTCFDPDAPTASGFWHWLLLDLPTHITELPRGIGHATGNDLPPGAFHTKNDGGNFGYMGAAPPAGDHPHRYIFAIHALDCEKLEVSPDVTGAVVGFHLTPHTLARAVLTPTYQQ